MSFGIQNISGKYMCVMSEREGKSEQMWTNLEYHAFMRRATVLIAIVAGTSHRVAPFGTGQEIDNDERLKKRYCPESEDRASLMLSTGQGAKHRDDYSTKLPVSPTTSMCSDFGWRKYRFIMVDHAQVRSV